MKNMKNKKKKMQALQPDCKIRKNQKFRMQDPVPYLKTEMLVFNGHLYGPKAINHISRWTGRVQALGFPLCTGPPGRARSPGARSDPEHPPDRADHYEPDSGFSPKLQIDEPESRTKIRLTVSKSDKNPVRNKGHTFRPGNYNQSKCPIRKQLDESFDNRINTEYQIIMNTLIFKFLQTFNSFIMKKQILFLAMFTLAMILAGTSTVFGQTLLGPALKPITPLACISGTPEPLHPFAGVPYTYSLDNLTTGEESAKIFTWWVTKDPAFIPTVGTNNSAGRIISPVILNPSANYGIATDIGTDATANTVTLTWSADILGATEYLGDVTAAGTIADPSPTFVVGYATGENCADNIQIFEINPLPNFSVNIAPIDPTDLTAALAWGDLLTGTDCVDQVQSASYDNTSKQITMDYGSNTIYFEVAAANFVKDWTPRFQIISGLNTTQTAIISVYSSLADATGAGVAVFTSASLTAADLATDVLTGEQFAATTPTDVVTGVSIYVKVVITNNTEESLASNPFILAVDAQDNTELGIWDMEDDDCGVLADAADQIDQAAITITPRPTLDDATIDDLTAPDTFILKTP